MKLHSKKLIIPVVLTLVIGGVIVYLLNRDKGPNFTKTKSGQSVNLDGPTDQEKKSGDAAKSEVIKDEQARNATPKTADSGKRSVSPSITYASQYGDQVEVGAVVSGVFEEGGTCTLTLTKDGASQTSSVTGVTGANSVNCPVMRIPVSSLGTGNWQAQVSYTSATSSGQSTNRAVEVK